MPKSKTKEQFIIEAKEKHGDKYDYSKVEYKKRTENVIILCKEHGEFLQTPSNHLKKQNCPKCSGRYKRTQNDFITEASIIHNEKYDYSLVKYTRTHNEVLVICKKHGSFSQTPKDHLQGSGCKKCATEIEHNKQRSNTEEFIEKAKIIHKNIYDYSKTIYIDAKSDIIIICKSHKEFTQRPNNHLNGSGCPKCSGVYRQGCNEFVEKAKELYGDIYDYSNIEYKNVDTIIEILCKTHGKFNKTPYNHINRNQGCTKCSLYKKYSKIQIEWLKFTSKYYNIDIQNGENDIEFKIPNTNYKADGFCELTNTIYEFHGDFWHGNPKKFNENDYNSICKKTFGDLYQKTLEREQLIRDLGYNLVVMWEHDWNNINKSIKILQRKFRSNR